MQNNELDMITIYKDYTEVEIKVISSYHCDLNCEYCYNKNINSNYLENLDEVLKSLNLILSKENLNVVVEIIGGEPLSNKTFPKTEKIIDYLISLRKNIKVMLQTGTPNIERIIKLIPKIDALSYSVDISESPKVSNIKNLQKISEICREHGVLIEIQTILSLKDNIETISQLIEKCNSYGIGWIGLGFPQYQLYTKEQLDKQINVYLELMDRLNNLSGITVGGALIESVLNFLEGRKYLSTCMCGEKSLAIQPDGTITPSLHFELNEVLSLENFNQIKSRRKNILRKRDCEGCKIWDICLGGCIGHAHFLTKDVLKPDKEYCYVLSGIINNLDASSVKH